MLLMVHWLGTIVTLLVNIYTHTHPLTHTNIYSSLVFKHLRHIPLYEYPLLLLYQVSSIQRTITLCYCRYIINVHMNVYILLHIIIYLYHKYLMALFSYKTNIWSGSRELVRKRQKKRKKLRMTLLSLNYFMFFVTPLSLACLLFQQLLGHP